MNKLEIINAALALLAVEPVTSLTTDQSDQAATVKAVYDMVYNAAIESYRWNFSVVTSTQLPEDTAESYDGLKRFAKPAQAVNIIGMHDADGRKIHYRTEDSLLVADNPSDAAANEFYLTYTVYPDEESLPGSFVKALIYDLAAEVCAALTESQTNAARLYDTARKLYRTAKALDAQKSGNPSFWQFEELPLINGR